jgi:hypothetical protein
VSDGSVEKLGPGEVRIPRTELGRQLAEAAAIKRRMRELLAQLEQRYIEGLDVSGKSTRPSRSWRRHPEDW